MDQQQFVELVNYTKLHGMFSVAGWTLGLVTVLALWGWFMKIVRRSDWDSWDRGLFIGIGTAVTFVLSGVFVAGICNSLPDIMAPAGSFLSDHVLKTDVFHVTR